MNQKELFEDETRRTSNAVKDLEIRLARLANEVRLLAADVQALRHGGRGVPERASKEIEQAVKALEGWRETLERRQDIMAAELAGRSLRMVR